WSEGTQEGGDVTDGARQQPEAVPASGAKPAGEIRARWAWVEAEVWTERMLTALEQGVIGGKWHSLMDKVYALPNRRRAFARVKANDGAAGVDHVTVEEFERDLEANLEKLSCSLADSSYRPRAVREPIFERDFAAQSYGFRPKRGCKEALRRVDTLLKQGYRGVVDADLKS